MESAMVHDIMTCHEMMILQQFETSITKTCPCNIVTEIFYNGKN